MTSLPVVSTLNLSPTPSLTSRLPFWVVDPSVLITRLAYDPPNTTWPLASTCNFAVDVPPMTSLPVVSTLNLSPTPSLTSRLPFWVVEPSALITRLAWPSFPICKAPVFCTLKYASPLFWSRISRLPVCATCPPIDISILPSSTVTMLLVASILKISLSSI